MSIKVLCFDIFGFLGHFRKMWTTSSPETYSFPPHSTVAGMLGSVIGVGKDKKYFGIKENEYLKVFSYNNCKIAIRLMKKIDKFKTTITLINTKYKGAIKLNPVFWSNMIYSPVQIRHKDDDKSHQPYTIVNTQLLYKPHYRIYVAHRDEDVFNELCERVREHRIYYHLSLGLAEFLCDINFVGIYDAELVGKKEEVEIVTVVPKRKVESFVPEEGKEYLKEEAFPIIMQPDREVFLYDDIIYERNGNSIKVVTSEFYRVNDECIIFY